MREASGCMMLGRQINHKKFIYEEFFPLSSLQSYWDPVQQNNNILKAEAVIYSGKSETLPQAQWVCPTRFTCLFANMNTVVPGQKVCILGREKAGSRSTEMPWLSGTVLEVSSRAGFVFPGFVLCC